jgi:predicted GNAT superfamily acetyltransferase
MTDPDRPASMEPVTDLDHAPAATQPAVEPAADGAVLAADAAARAAGVRIREVSALGDLDAIVRLYDRIWKRDKNPPLTTELLRAFSKAGNYVAAAFADGELVGACVGFFAAPAHEALHSHIAGVSPGVRGRRVGFALKLHQRAWALLRGTSLVAWTFDPLVSRNAYFNLVKLGARPVEYLPNFYGAMRDGINGGDDSDRLLVHWPLTAPEVVAACAGDAQTVPTGEARALLAASALGRPVSLDPATPTVLVAVPDDVEALRTTDPGLAKEWRVAVRDALTGLFAGGGQVVGFARPGGYVVQRGGS